MTTTAQTVTARLARPVHMSVKVGTQHVAASVQTIPAGTLVYVGRPRRRFGREDVRRVRLPGTLLTQEVYPASLTDWSTL